MESFEPCRYKLNMRLQRNKYWKVSISYAHKHAVTTVEDTQVMERLVEVKDTVTNAGKRKLIPIDVRVINKNFATYIGKLSHLSPRTRSIFGVNGARKTADVKPVMKEEITRLLTLSYKIAEDCLIEPLQRTTPSAYGCDEEMTTDEIEPNHCTIIKLDKPRSRIQEFGHNLGLESDMRAESGYTNDDEAENGIGISVAEVRDDAKKVQIQFHESVRGYLAQGSLRREVAWLQFSRIFLLASVTR